MAERKQGREIAFVETEDAEVKKRIEKAFLRQGVSFLIKADKVRCVRKGRFESRMKYSFYINRLQADEARAAVGGQGLEEGSFRYLA